MIKWEYCECGCHGHVMSALGLHFQCNDHKEEGSTVYVLNVSKRGDGPYGGTDYRLRNWDQVKRKAMKILEERAKEVRKELRAVSRFLRKGN